MPPTTLALYLTVLALGIHFVLGALQSGTFTTLLQKFSVPAIPTAVLPWLGLVLGLVAGVVKELQAGDTLVVAIAQAIISSLTGGVAAMHLQFISGRPDVGGRAPGAASKTLIAAGAVGVGAIGAVEIKEKSPPAPPPAPPPPIAAKRWIGTRLATVVAGGQ